MYAFNEEFISDVFVNLQIYIYIIVTLTIATRIIIVTVTLVRQNIQNLFKIDNFGGGPEGDQF